MGLAGEQVLGHAAPGVKMGGIGRAVRVHRHQDPLPLDGPLKDNLPVGQHHVPVRAIAEGAAAPAGLRHFGDPVRQIAPLRHFHIGPQGVVPVGLAALDAPLAAVVHRRHARHAEEQAVGGDQVLGIVQAAGDPLHIVVVQEAEQMLALVEGPVLRPELPGQAVADLKEIHGVEAGPEALVALVVGDRVAGVVVHPPVVVPVEGLPQEDKIGLHLVGELSQLGEIVRTQAVGHVQPQAVDVELLHPGADGVEPVQPGGGRAPGSA